MGKIITVDASLVWRYYVENSIILASKMLVIARNDEYGVKIYITTDSEYRPIILVTADDSTVYEENVTKNDCERTVSKIYDSYLTNKAIENLDPSINADDDDGEEYDEETDIEEIIEHREDELDMAISDMFCVIFGDDPILDTIEDKVLEDVKEHILNYLYLRHGLEIYRPMYVDYGNGEEEFEEYPYEHLDIENSYSVVYKPNKDKT